MKEIARDTSVQSESAVLVGVELPGAEAARDNLDELAGLVRTAGAEVVAAKAIAAATSSWWTSCSGVPGSGKSGFSKGNARVICFTGQGSWFHSIASASAGAFGPATMQGLSTNTSSVEPRVISASAASHAAFCSE